MGVDDAVRVTTDVPAEAHAVLEAVAAERGVSVEAVGREAIVEWIDRYRDTTDVAAAHTAAVVEDRFPSEDMETWLAHAENPYDDGTTDSEPTDGGSSGNA